MDDIVIVGDQVAGESAKLRADLTAAIKDIRSRLFDVAELLYKAQQERLYTEPSFKDYVKSLGFKYRRAQYMTSVIGMCEAMNLVRPEYEAIGMGKLRAIARLDCSVEATYTNPADGQTTPMRDWIMGLIELAPSRTVEEIESHVRVLKGEVGELDMVWENFRVLRQARDLTIRPAIDKMKLLLGTTQKDFEGVAVDTSPGRCLEAICARFLTEEIDDEG